MSTPNAPRYAGPLLTRATGDALTAAHAAGHATWRGSLDLGRSHGEAQLGAEHWHWQDIAYPYPGKLKDRTLYWWDGDAFAPVSRYAGKLIKLVPTDWQVPTFEIDGIKMLPTAQVSPYADAERKVGLIEPRGKRVLDTCGGLGYFAAWCLRGGALQVQSFEKNPDVIWLRRLNAWSPEHAEDGQGEPALRLSEGDVAQRITELPSASMDAALHDPPRFGIAGELYSQAFYNELARVLKPRARLFHYTGTPNKLTSRRDVPREVASRLQKAGFSTELNGDGVLAVRAR